MLSTLPSRTMLFVRSPKHASLAVAPGSAQAVAHSTTGAPSPRSARVGGALSFTRTVRTTGEVTSLRDGARAEEVMVNWPGRVGSPSRVGVTATAPAHTSLAEAPGST